MGVGEEQIILVFRDGYQKKVFAPLGIREYRLPVFKRDGMQFLIFQRFECD